MKRSRLQPSTILNRALVVALAVTTATTLRSQPQITSAQLASLTPLELTNCLSQGNYYYLHGPAPDQPYPPLPAAPLDLPGETPVYDLGGGCFLIDDSAVDWNALWQQREIDGTSEQSMRANAMSATFGGSLLTPLDLSSYTGLWLEIPPGGVDESNVSVIVHNTFEWQAYTVLTTEDLSAASWAEEQWLYGTNGDSTPIQLARNGRTNLCIWARSGAPSSTLAIVSQPLDQTVLEGDTVTFSVVATGSGTLTYQWTCYGESIPGGTNNSYTINNVQAGDALYYAVTVLNGVTSVSSHAAWLTVLEGTGDPLYTYVQGPRQDYSFKNGVTYCISSPVELYGTTTLRGGSVIKFGCSYSTNSSLVVKGALVCETEPYLPAILTSVDDRSQGVLTFGSSPNPQPATNGVAYLNLAASSSSTISNLRICFADIGVTTPVLPRKLDVWDCQFYQCNIAIANQVWGFGARDILHNVLFAQCGAAIGASTNSVEVEAEHVTADVSTFWTAPSPPYKLALTNSILLGSFEGSSIVITQNTAINPAGTVFQPESLGNYYLAVDSPLHHAGTANISPALASEMHNKTTYAPIALAAYLQVSGEMTLGPQVPRYSSGAPDLGYWYDALDYTVGALTLSGGTVRILPGTAIAVRNEYVPAYNTFTVVGFWVGQGSTLVSHGTPLQPNVFTATKLVQETPATAYWQYQAWGEMPFGVISLVADYEPNEAGSPAPTLDFRFCKFCLSAQDYQFWSGISEDGQWMTSPDSSVFWALQDCIVRGGRINLGPPDYYWFGEDYVFAPGAVSWKNSLFDQVSVTLNPTFYWDIEVLNSDLSLQAYNNLFRGGQWFMLEPIPATAGNWVFKDNLFDKVEFWQDTAEPLDHDSNGYWPMLASELRYIDTASRLVPTNSVSDQVLSSAPPYQSGPLGDYYLPTTTPLYHAGSRTANDAGLFHYTTRVDQTKEGSGQMVNIGLHYVATTNSACFLPRDSEGDGIPDYVENWHGDGDFNTHIGQETDWQNDNSTLGPEWTPVADKYSLLYDDVDLSGNGLVGRIKKALNQEPFDTSNPLTLTQITTGQEPDTAVFELPISYDLLTNIGGLNLNLDGFDVTLEHCARATNGTNTLLTWNTSYDPPGLHFLQPRLTLNGTGGGTAILTGLGHLVPFYSDNVCRFFKSGALFDQSGAYLDAQLPVPNASYSIRLYDPSTNPPTLLKTIPTKSTSSGMIQEDWDLTCDNSTNSFAGSAFDAVFDITLLDGPGGASVAHGTPTSRYGQTASNEQGNGFDVAYMCTPQVHSLDSEFSSPSGCVWIGMQGVVETLIGLLTPLRYDSSFNQFRSPDLPSGKPGYVGSTTTATSLCGSLWDGLTKNFYCYAHGTPNSLQNQAGDVTIQARLVASMLDNDKEIPYSPYRFVFLDACWTIVNHQWRDAFGIMPFGPVGQAGRSILGPQAFVGWDGPSVGWLDGPLASGDETRQQSIAVQSAYLATLQFFFSEWMNGQPLVLCLRDATDPYNPSQVPCPMPVPKIDTVTIGSPYISPPYAVANRGPKERERRGTIRIYGHPGLTRNGLDPVRDTYRWFDAGDNRP